MDIYVQVLVWIYVFSFCGYIPRSRIAGSYGNSKFNLKKKFDSREGEWG